MSQRNLHFVIYREDGQLKVWMGYEDNMEFNQMLNLIRQDLAEKGETNSGGNCEHCWRVIHEEELRPEHKKLFAALVAMQNALDEQRDSPQIWDFMSSVCQEALRMYAEESQPVPPHVL